MYGVQNINSQALQTRTKMRLCGKKFDASKFIVAGIAFIGFVAVLSAVAVLQPRRLLRVLGSLMHQSVSLGSKFGALTIRPSGPANTPLRSVSAVH